MTRIADLFKPEFQLTQQTQDIQKKNEKCSICGQDDKCKDKIICKKIYKKICISCYLKIKDKKESILNLIGRRIRARANIKQVLIDADVPKRFLDCSFQTFNGSTKGIDSIPIQSTEFLFIWGNTPGIGKTHLAIAHMRRMLWHGKQFRFIRATDLLSDIKNTFNENSYSTEKNVIEKYSDLPALLIDDIGTEKNTEYVLQSWYQIIDRRYGNMKHTVFTSNYSLNEIAIRLGDRLASRLGSGKVAHLDSKNDYRKK